MIALDTNILVRFVTRDDPLQTEAADGVLKTEGAKFLLLDSVLIELFWTLRRLYMFSKEEVIEVLEAFTQRADIEFEDRDRLNIAVSFSKQGYDFADLLIMGQARHRGATAFVTFDDRLAKLDSLFVAKPGS